MRLINTDDIPWNVDGVGEIPVITKEEIDAMPTVGAIPIEWIRKYTKETPLYQSDDLALYIDDMIADWAERKEE